MDIFGSNSNLMMEKAMDFLWTKQAATLDNIANAETPNYKPKVVTFEEDLRTRLESARRTATPAHDTRKVLRDAKIRVEEQQESTRMDDNGVN